MLLWMCGKCQINYRALVSPLLGDYIYALAICVVAHLIVCVVLYPRTYSMIIE